MKTYKSFGIMVVAAMALWMGFGGCDSTGPTKPVQTATNQAAVKTGGTVVFRETNGGFYGILTDNGGQYEPKNLDPKFRADGLRISFTGQLDTSHLGEHRWGNPIDLANVKSSEP